MTRDLDEPDDLDAPPTRGAGSDPESDTRPIGPVRWSVLAVIAVVGGLAAFLVVRISELAGGTPPELPWTLPVVLGLAAGGVAVLARSTHRRVHLEGRWIAAQRGIRLLALGRTAVLTGAFVTGFGLVFALLFVTRAAVEVSLLRTLVGGAIAAVGLGLVFAGRALERACHIPEDDEAPPRAPSGGVRR